MLYIVVPIYNVCTTLKRCIDSIVSQSFHDWEMLLIDDGSTDGSGKIADEIAMTDSRISCYHKQNGGLSDARNYGIDIIRTKSKTQGARNETYITFIDSDDTIAPDTLSALMHILKKNKDCDVLEYSVLVHANHESAHKLTLPDKTWSSAREYWHHTCAWEHCYAWNKIYRTSLFNNCYFPKGKFYEDVWTWPVQLTANPQIITTSKGMYNYIWNDSGITANAGARRLIDLCMALLQARNVMHTTLFSHNGWLLYRSILCRQIDIYRLSGEIILTWPLTRFICKLHAKKKGGRANE